MDFVEYADRDTAARALAGQVAVALKTQLLEHERVSLAVPGGTTPGPIFDALAASDLAWSRVTIMLTDERWVPDDHARSNAGLIRTRLLQGPAAQAQFLPFFRAGQSAEDAAPQLSTELASCFPLSLLVLGMGADMHTASLFPGADGLHQALSPDAPAICAIRAESQPDTRITLSAPILSGAQEKHAIIFGDDKRRAWQDARNLPAQDAPIAAVMDGGTVHWAP
ncbi:MAG: 6-phosphogluconolactonase [Roseobacter sp.]